jgi:hypothetical protein
LSTALKSPFITRVLGAEHGIKGVLNDRLFDMSKEDPKELELLKYTPSSALGSCRYKMADPDVDDTDYKRILEIFKKYDVRYFFYNGGNDSMDTCNKISQAICRRSAMSAGSWACPRPSTTTSSARTTAPASAPRQSISPPPAWRSIQDTKSTIPA